LGLCAHALNCVHHVGLLREERISQVRRPLDIASHPLNDVRKRYQRLDAWVPRLLGHSVGQGFVLQVLIIRVPLLKLDHFQRVSGSRQRLGKKRIRIKSNRRYQRIQLVGWNRRCLLVGSRPCQWLVLLCVRQRVCRHE
jgi:hypothetical protein